jgi:DNA-binding transcriptional regulator GbsR (MarR family)
MATPTGRNPDPAIRKIIQEAGNTTQALGLGRICGQLYAYLFFSQEPRSLSDMQEALGISKGSASMNVRQLEQWGAAEKVWVKGDRKDYYTANEWLGKVVRNILNDLASRRLTSYDELLDNAMTDLPENGNREFLAERVAILQKFCTRVRRAWENPIVKALVR